MTPQDFAAKIKQKYPQYKNVEDIELANRIITKYPEYKDKVDFGMGVQTDTSAQPEQSGAIAGFAKGIGESALGALHGVGRIGRGIQKTIAGGAEKIGFGSVFPTGKPGVFDEGSEEFAKAKEITTPETTSEKVGKIAGDILQYVIPVSKVSKATSGASLLSRVLAEGSVSGGIAALQSGEFGKDARDVAIVSALFPAGGALLKAGKTAAGGVIGKEGASRIVDSLIKPLKKDLAYGKNPGRAVAEEGIVANTLDELETKIGARLEKRLGDLKNMLSGGNAKVTLDNVFKPLDDAMQTAAKQNNEALLKRIQETRKALEENLVLSTDDAGNYVINTAGKRNLANMTAEELTQFKRDIGDITAYTGNASDDKLVNAALRDIYSSVKLEIEKAVPGAKEVNTRIADLISAKTATKYRADIAERQNLIGLGEKVVGAGGLVASLATGNPVPAILGLGAIGAEKALSTPRAKTELAKWLAGASSVEKKELFNKAPWIKGIINKIIFDIEE